MRKRRALVYDDDPAVLGVVALLFEALGYEVVASTEPVACAARDPCGCRGQGLPCADVLVTDLEMPGLSGLELLAAQARHGCLIAPQNKAVLSGRLDEGAVQAVRRLGCACFSKPLRLVQLRQWLAGCEARADGNRPLAETGREPLEPEHPEPASPGL